MYSEYQSYKIIIYYDDTTLPFLGWAKTFWLLKTAHPIETVKLNNAASFDEKNPYKWICDNLPEFKNYQGIFVPATIRPVIDIDFFADSHQNNRFCIFANLLPSICILDSSCKNYEKNQYDGVFEDLSAIDKHYIIKEEIEMIKKKLLMNI